MDFRLLNKLLGQITDKTAANHSNAAVIMHMLHVYLL